LSDFSEKIEALNPPPKGGQLRCDAAMPGEVCGLEEVHRGPEISSMNG
jgi:hypothetical protein